MIPFRFMGLLMTPSSDAPQFADELVRWQRAAGRHALPWQRFSTPYERLVSEVMLQQTQVETVIPYFERFLKAFPTPETLAGAKEDDVMALWAGLGYYTRARNLKRAAQKVVDELGGRFPTDSAGLLALPGVGPSTAAAVAAFTSGEAKTPMVDGNVKRVLARVFLIEGAVGEKAFEKAVYARALAELPESAEIGAYTQGLMDLGSGVCRRTKPDCAKCPMAGRCLALRAGRTADVPGKKRPTAKQHQRLLMAFVLSPEGLWLRRVERSIWRGLWVPATTEDEDWAQFKKTIGTYCPQAAVVESMHLPPIRHELTHRRLLIEAAVYRLDRSPSMPEGFSAFSLDALPGMPKPAAAVVKDYLQRRG